MYIVHFTEGADKDFDSILDYIAQDSVENAIKFTNDLRSRIVKNFSSTPRIGVKIDRKYRFFPFGNYIVVYRIDDESKIVYVFLISERHRQWKVLMKDRT